MAQTQHAQREPANETESETQFFDWPQADWNECAKTRKYRGHDGKVWSGGDRMLFHIAPPDLRIPAVRAMVFQAVAQFMTNRVGQVAEGNVQDAITKCLREGVGIPAANTNDAFERHFMNTVADRVAAIKGDLPANASKEAKAERDTIVVATAIKARGGEGVENEKFAEFRDLGIAAALNKPITEKKRQPKKAADTSAAVEI